MRRMPKRLRVGHRSILVSREQRLVRQDLDDSEDAVGRYFDTLSTIVVSPKLKYDAASSTLWHEVIHATFAECGLTDAVANIAEHEELIVSALANGLLSAMRRNPALVRYLMETT